MISPMLIWLARAAGRSPSLGQRCNGHVCAAERASSVSSAANLRPISHSLSGQVSKCAMVTPKAIRRELGALEL